MIYLLWWYYQRFGELFESVDLLVAQYVVERVDDRIERLLFHLNGHQAKVCLIAVVVPAFKFRHHFSALHNSLLKKYLLFI